MPKLGKYYLVSGRVQGVFYRRFVQEQARKLGVTGVARNRRDRRVEVFAFGTEQQLQDLREALKQGSPESEVTGIYLHDTPVDELTDFSVE